MNRYIFVYLYICVFVHSCRNKEEEPVLRIVYGDTTFMKMQEVTDPITLEAFVEDSSKYVFKRLIPDTLWEIYYDKEMKRLKMYVRTLNNEMVNKWYYYYPDGNKEEVMCYAICDTKWVCHQSCDTFIIKWYNSGIVKELSIVDNDSIIEDLYFNEYGMLYFRWKSSMDNQKKDQETWERWYDNGQKSYEVVYINNGSVKKSIRWYKNGNIMYIKYYSYKGEPIDTWKYYTETGELMKALPGKKVKSELWDKTGSFLIDIIEYD